MKTNLEIEFIDIEESEKLSKIAQNVVNQCFIAENIQNLNLYLNIILTDANNIRETNKKYRNIDKETDVLSFPMFEKSEIEELVNKKQKLEGPEVLGDIMISIPRVEEQAIEYGHSFEREFAYMLVHGFYHIMGYDHIVEEDKKEMRKKEESVLALLALNRE